MPIDHLLKVETLPGQVLRVEAISISAKIAEEGLHEWQAGSSEVWLSASQCSDSLELENWECAACSPTYWTQRQMKSVDEQLHMISKEPL